MQIKMLLNQFVVLLWVGADHLDNKTDRIMLGKVRQDRELTQDARMRGLSRSDAGQLGASEGTGA